MQTYSNVPRLAGVNRKPAVGRQVAGRKASGRRRDIVGIGIVIHPLHRVIDRNHEGVGVKARAVDRDGLGAL